MFKEKIKNGPNWVQKPIKHIYYNIPREIIMGKEFMRTYKFLQDSQWWTEKQLKEYQMIEIEKLLKHAYENVPYYKRIFNERGLKPKDIQNFQDLKQLPYLTKEIIRDNIKDLVAVNYNKKQLEYVTTGGSTGIPMGFYMDKKKCNAREWAFMTTQWNRVGYNVSGFNRCVILRGNVPSKGIYEYQGLNLILSSYHLTEENMVKYIKLIEDFKPSFIQAYPSSISILSDFILENKIKINVNGLKAILCGSENMYDYQRKKIRQAFGVRVYSWYGHSEQCCLAGECEQSGYYHIFSEYGYSEIINRNNEEVNSENEVGEIIATGFSNYAMPFIRYKTRDLAINTNKKCKCGRNHKLIKKIHGREQEKVIGKNGAEIPITSIIFAQHFNAFGKISGMQLEQNDRGKIIVKLIKRNDFNNDDSYEIKNKIEEATKNQLDVKIMIVDELDRTSSGKCKLLVQNFK